MSVATLPRHPGTSGEVSSPPRVTVVMPAHNSETTVREAVESILGQSLSDFELIVVDDGSTDGTEAVLRSFSDRRVRYVRQENAGYPSAMNRGLEMARGKYVARMDADDLAAPDRLQAQVSFLEENPDYAAVGTLYDIVTPHGRTWQRQTGNGGEAWAAVDWESIIDGHRNFADGSVMFRIDSARHAGGYRTYQRSGQDVDLWLRLLEDGNGFAVLNRVLYFLRISLGALTGRPMTGAYNKVPRILARERREQGNDRVMRGEPLDGLLTPDILARAAFWHVRDLWIKARICFSAGDWRAGLQFALRAAIRGGISRNNLGQGWEFLQSVLRANRDGSRPGEESA